MKTGAIGSRSAAGASILAAVLAVVLAGWLMGETASGEVAQVVPPLATLKGVPVPEPPNLFDFVRGDTPSERAAARAAGIRLGKALFWDMQVGSDGAACATCHFHAGADFRTRNQLTPNTPATFTAGGPNHALTGIEFSLAGLGDDVVSSQGVVNTTFVDIIPGSAVERGTVVSDTVFHVGPTNTRRVEPRNTPSVINAVFNFRNFWDGRAQNEFNGVNPFGTRDTNARVLRVQPGGAVITTSVVITNSSLASQAVGPPGNGTEMSFAGRSFPKIGKKLLSVRPLGMQMVHPDDSVLGAIASSRVSASKPGLEANYSDMIKAAFKNEWWDSNKVVTFDAGGNRTISDPPGRALTTGEFTVMEANFSLFFGLAVQLYEATLVSDDSPFDRGTLTADQQAGMVVFQGKGKCDECHSGPEITAASVGNVANQRLERVTIGGIVKVRDTGFINIGVRPGIGDTADDRGIGGNDPFGNQLSDTWMALNGKFTDPNLVPPLAPGEPMAVDGSFKVASLRNAELTGPYFHNGGKLTLRDAVQFYVTGGDFRNENAANLDPNIIANLGLSAQEVSQIVEFLKSLTDDRVRFERAPFDHPEIFVANGHLGNELAVTDKGSGVAADLLMRVPASGAAGLSQPLGTFDAELGRFNQAPVAANDSAVVVANSANNSVSVLANDSDPDSDPIALSFATQGANGSVTVLLAEGKVLYTPNAGFGGQDSFTYFTSDGFLSSSATVSVVVDRAPVAADDTAAVAPNSGGTTINVLSNDSDADGNTLTVTAVTTALSGTVAIGSGGAGVVYTPSAGFTGVDTFGYTISDGVLLTATARVTVTVDRAPVAVNESVVIATNSSNNVLRVLANDSDPDGDTLTVTAFTQGANGSVAIGGGGTTVLYTPNAGFKGPDSFTYTVGDGLLTAVGTVNVDVVQVNSAPVASGDSATVLQNSSGNLINVLANDSDPDGNPVSVVGVGTASNGTAAVNASNTGVTYTPNPGFTGSDTFTYTVTDGLLTATGTVNVTVALPGQPPIFRIFAPALWKGLQ